jgi:hypothetical protein
MSKNPIEILKIGLTPETPSLGDGNCIPTDFYLSCGTIDKNQMTGDTLSVERRRRIGNVLAEVAGPRKSDCDSKDNCLR